MRKKSDKELGVVLPEGMVDTINNRDLTDAQVGKIIRAITWNSMEYAQDDIVAKQLTTSLIGTYRTQNRIRITRIKMVRGWKSEYEKKKRERAKLAEEKLLQQVDDTMDFHGNSMDFHGTTIVRKERNNIPPIIPLAGDEKSSSAKTDVHAHTGKTTTRPTTGGPTTGCRRTGTTKQHQKGALDADNGTARTKAGSARPTARKLARSGDIRERPEQTSKKTGAPGLWDGAAVVVNAAEAMMARHPNSKSGKRAVVRAIAATVEEEPGEGPETVDAIAAAHEAWCATDGWAEDKGQFVQALAAWIRNGGWRKLPPQKKKPAPSKGDEISFDASL